MMRFTAPPSYVRTKRPAKPKLDPFIPVIDRILFDDKSRPRKQQHCTGIIKTPITGNPDEKHISTCIVGT